MAFWTPAALPFLRSSEGSYGQIHYPSGFTPQGVRSSASGGYGFLDSTWRTYAPKVGVDINQYPRAYLAPPDVQDQVALNTPVSNWTCPGCNSTANVLAQNPSYVASVPVSGGAGFDDGSGSFINFSDNGQPLVNYTDFLPTGSGEGAPQGFASTGDNQYGSGLTNDFSSFPGLAFNPSDVSGGYGVGGGIVSGTGQALDAGTQGLGLSPDISNALGPIPTGEEAMATGDSFGGLGRDPFGNPSPGAGGFTPADSGAIASQWWNTAVGITGDYLTRFGLVLLAMILIAAAAFALARGGELLPGGVKA